MDAYTEMITKRAEKYNTTFERAEVASTVFWGDAPLSDYIDTDSASLHEVIVFFAELSEEEFELYTI